MTLKTVMMSNECDAENSALPSGINYISKYIKIENSCFKLYNISQYYCFLIK